MDKKKQVLWLSWHPSHYNDYLFQELSRIYNVNFEAVFLRKVLPSHPWGKDSAYQFKKRYLKTVWFPDIVFFIEVLLQRKFFVIAGWNNINMLLGIVVLSFLNKKFAIWSDTPNLEIRRSWIKKQTRNLFLKWLFRKVHIVLTTGEPGKRAFVEMGCPEAKVVNFPFATDLDFFKPIDEVKATNGEVIFLMSGRIDWKDKGQDKALYALKSLLQKGYTCKLRIAGTGPDMDKTVGLIKKLKLEDYVELVGWLELEELPGFYTSGQVFLHPSSFDPYPNSVLEALACGTPVIASEKAGSAADRILDWKNGFLLHNTDNSVLSDIMQRFLDTPSLIARMSAMARDIATKHGVQNNVTSIKEIINALP